MTPDIRTVRPDEWPQLKELRLAALGDPVGRVAFGSTYEREAAFEDEVWRRRAAGVTFVAVDGGDGGDGWAGMATLLEEDGQAHLVGMYVRPAHRGGDVAERLVRALVARAWERPETARVRLWVTETNDRARAFYRRLGFLPTGVTEPHAPLPELTAYELALTRPRTAASDPS